MSHQKQSATNKPKTLVFIETFLLKGLKPYFWLASTGFILYFQTLFFGYTYLDDNTLIMDHQFFLKNFWNIFLAFTQEVFHILHTSAAYYRPLLTISFIFDAQISGSNLWMYHLTDILLHILSAWLVFVLLQKIKVGRMLSFFFALIFVVHPILTQAVAWVPGRNDSLLTVFTLLSFVFLIRYLENFRYRDIFFHLLFFAFALFTKETALMIPVLVFLYLQLIKKDKLFSKTKYLLVAGCGIFGLAWFILRAIALQNPLKMTVLDMVWAMLTNLPAVIQYIGKIFFPLNLSVLPIMKDTTFLWGILAVLVLFVLFLLTKNKRYNYITFGLIWFLFFLLPSFIRPNTEIAPDFIEHRVYLPILGLFIVLLEFWPFREIGTVPKKGTVPDLGTVPRTWLGLAALVVIVLSSITFSHSQNFANGLAFWKDAAQNSPDSPLAHRNLGVMLYFDHQN